jgi:hypothetical protein
MADPISGTLLAVSLGASVAGGVTTAMGKGFESKAQSNMYQYQAGMAQINKQIDEQNAAYARSGGEVEAQKSGMRSRFQLGGIKVTKAAGNIDVNSGSAREVQDSQEAIGQHDQSIIRSNAARQAYGYDVEAAGHKAQVGMYGMASENALTTGKIGVAGSLISTAGSVANKWYGASSSFGSSGSGSGPSGGSDYAGLGGWQ